MEKIKLYIILSIAVLSALVIGVVLINVLKAGETQDNLINSTSSDPLATSQQSQTSVTIQNRAFGPAKITVKKGQTVTWTNQDAIEHSVVPDNPTSDFKESQLLGRGQTYSATFNETGTFTYFCGPHPDMTGTVEVTE